MLRSFYNYLFGNDLEVEEDMLIIKKSININNMNKLLEDSYKVIQLFYFILILFKFYLNFILMYNIN